MKHRSISIISIVGAVIAGLISVGNLVQLMVIKAQELKERGTDNFLSDLLMYPLDADFRDWRSIHFQYDIVLYQR